MNFDKDYKMFLKLKSLKIPTLSGLHDDDPVFILDKKTNERYVFDQAKLTPNSIVFADYRMLPNGIKSTDANKIDLLKSNLDDSRKQKILSEIESQVQKICKMGDSEGVSIPTDAYFRPLALNGFLTNLQI